MFSQRCSWLVFLSLISIPASVSVAAVKSSQMVVPTACANVYALMSESELAAPVPDKKNVDGDHAVSMNLVKLKLPQVVLPNAGLLVPEVGEPAPKGMERTDMGTLDQAVQNLIRYFKIRYPDADLVPVISTQQSATNGGNKVVYFLASKGPGIPRDVAERFPEIHSAENEGIVALQRRIKQRTDELEARGINPAPLALLQVESAVRESAMWARGGMGPEQMFRPLAEIVYRNSVAALQVFDAELRQQDALSTIFAHVMRQVVRENGLFDLNDRQTVLMLNELEDLNLRGVTTLLSNTSVARIQTLLNGWNSRIATDRLEREGLEAELEKVKQIPGSEGQIAELEKGIEQYSARIREMESVLNPLQRSLEQLKKNQPRLVHDWQLFASTYSAREILWGSVLSDLARIDSQEALETWNPIKNLAFVSTLESFPNLRIVALITLSKGNGFFDPMTRKWVDFKGDIPKLMEKYGDHIDRVLLRLLLSTEQLRAMYKRIYPCALEAELKHLDDLVDRGNWETVDEATRALNHELLSWLTSDQGANSAMPVPLSKFLQRYLSKQGAGEETPEDIALKGPGPKGKKKKLGQGPSPDLEFDPDPIPQEVAPVAKGPRFRFLIEYDTAGGRQENPYGDPLDPVLPPDFQDPQFPGDVFPFGNEVIPHTLPRYLSEHTVTIPGKTAEEGVAIFDKARRAAPFIFDQEVKKGPIRVKERKKEAKAIDGRGPEEETPEGEPLPEPKEETLPFFEEKDLSPEVDQFMRIVLTPFEQEARAILMDNWSEQYKALKAGRGFKREELARQDERRRAVLTGTNQILNKLRACLSDNATGFEEQSRGNIPAAEWLFVERYLGDFPSLKRIVLHSEYPELSNLQYAIVFHFLSGKFKHDPGDVFDANLLGKAKDLKFQGVYKKRILYGLAITAVIVGGLVSSHQLHQVYPNVPDPFELLFPGNDDEPLVIPGEEEPEEEPGKEPEEEPGKEVSALRNNERKIRSVFIDFLDGPSVVDS